LTVVELVPPEEFPEEFPDEEPPDEEQAARASRATLIRQTGHRAECFRMTTPIGL
jgi:hypothetical protein